MGQTENSAKAHPQNSADTYASAASRRVSARSRSTSVIASLRAAYIEDKTVDYSRCVVVVSGHATHVDLDMPRLVIVFHAGDGGGA